MFFLKRQKGQGMVEFALILPVLLMILLGIIETAVVFQSYLAVQHAAREAARFAVTMEPPQGQMIHPDFAEPVDCDGVTEDVWGFTCYPDETLTQWQARRVRISQEVAIQQAAGLAKNYLAYEWSVPEGESPDPLICHPDGGKPRFFGVLVRGYHGVEETAFDYWYPGLEGLPVVVNVYYNVRLLDPFYQALIPGGQVRVTGGSSMINEGATVGLAHLPLPNFRPTPTHPPLTATHTPTPGIPPATATPTDTPTPASTEGPTPTPTDTPTLTPTPTVPYIVVSRYEGVHAGDSLTAWLHQHTITTTTFFDLWWYTDVPTGAGQTVTETVATNISVTGGLSEPVQFLIPYDTEGTYHLVSKEAGAGEIEPEFARSNLITVDPLPPDLVVRQLNVPEQVDYAGEEPLTVTLEIANLTATGVYTTFDIDIYVDPSRDPDQGFPGYHKQWRTGIGPYGTVSATIPISDVIELWSGGQHEVWAQVDTSNRVPDELTKTNNITGPVMVDAGCPNLWEDDFTGADGDPPDSRWTFEDINTPGSPGDAQIINNQLRIRTRGTTLWGGNNSFSFLYQMVEGDFDARVQVTSPMDYDGDYAKIGLMVRQDAQPNSPYVMINRHSDSGESEKIQYAVREDRGANPNASDHDDEDNVPVWLRIVRQENAFDLYYSADSTNDPEAVSGWELAYHYEVPSGPEDHDFDLDVPLMVGIPAAAYHGDSRNAGRVDNFWICLVGEGGQPSIPRYGNESCTQPIQIGIDQPVGGGSFELGWDDYWTRGEEEQATKRQSEEDHTGEIFFGGAYSMRFHAETVYWEVGCGVAVPLHPWLAQSISIPSDADDVVEMPDGSTEPMIVTMQTDFWHLVEPRATPRPDPFLLTVRDVSGATPITLTNTGTFTDPGDVLIVRGDHHDPGHFHSFSGDLVTYMADAGHDVADYAGQDLQLYWYAPNPYDPCDPANIPPSAGAPDLTTTWVYLDDVSVEVCTIWPTPPISPTRATISGTLQVLIHGSLEDAPGTLVWAYSVGGELYMTYSIHDSTYHFYNLPPETYTVYSEIVVDEDRYYTLETIALPQGVTEHNLVLK